MRVIKRTAHERTRRRARQGERGSAALAAVSLIAFLAVAALVIDFGVLMVSRTEISGAVDAAALAAAQELPDQAAARSLGAEYVGYNVSPTRDGSPVPTITFPSANTVRVHATMNPSALFARALGLTDFTVGAAAEATRFDPDIAIIIDRSGSMCQDSHGLRAVCPVDSNPWEPFTTIQRTAKGFVDQLPANSIITLISFSTLATADGPPTTNKAEVKRHIGELVPGGYTDIAASVTLAIDKLLLISGNRPKLIVLLTDGVPNVVDGVQVPSSNDGPQTSLLAAGRRAFDKGQVIYGINYGVQADNSLMQRVAESTEGTFYFAPTTAALKVVYSGIADKVHIRLTAVD